VLGKPGVGRAEASLHPIDREFRGSVGKPVFPFGNGACAGVRAMALLDERRLAAEQARRAKYRLHHVGTKLNEGELRAFEALRIRGQNTGTEYGEYGGIRGNTGTDGTFPLRFLACETVSLQQQSSKVVL